MVDNAMYTEITKDEIAVKFDKGATFPCYYDVQNPKLVYIHHIKESAVPFILLSIVFFIGASISFILPFCLLGFCVLTFTVKSKWNFMRLKEEDTSDIIY